MRSGKATYWQLTSLQAFWPGLQTLVGDVSAANLSHREFFYVWKKYGVLPERCKYLYLLYDDLFLAGRNFVFTTEGHPLPVRSLWHERLPVTYNPSNWTSSFKDDTKATRVSALESQVCPEMIYGSKVESACHVPDLRVNHRCTSDAECGIDSTNCRKRTCSAAGYCGLWRFVH